MVYVAATCPRHAPAADLTIFHAIKTAAASAHSGAAPFRISVEKVKTAAASAVCHFNACPHPHLIMRSNRRRVTPRNVYLCREGRRSRGLRGLPLR